MHAGAVPVTLHRLGRQRHLDVVLLAQAEQQVAGDPQVIGNRQRVGRTDLELPLAGHDLGVGAGDHQAGFDAQGRVLLDDVATVDLGRTDAAVVGALRFGEPVGREAGGPAVEVQHRVLLLEAEQGLLVLVLLVDLAGLGTRVGRVRRPVLGQGRLAHDQDVVTTTDGVGAAEDGLEDDIGVVAAGLVGRRTVEPPDPGLGAVGEDLGLRADFGGGFRPVDPEVFSTVGHGWLQSVHDWTRGRQRHGLLFHTCFVDRSGPLNVVLGWSPVRISSAIGHGRHISTGASSSASAGRPSRSSARYRRDSVLLTVRRDNVIVSAIRWSEAPVAASRPISS